MVGDMTSRRKSQESNVVPSGGGNANSTNGIEGRPRRESRSWAGGSRIDDFFAAAVTKGMKEYQSSSYVHAYVHSSIHRYASFKTLIGYSLSSFFQYLFHTIQYRTPTSLF